MKTGQKGHGKITEEKDRQIRYKKGSIEESEESLRKDHHGKDDIG